MTSSVQPPRSLETFPEFVASRVNDGARFAGLFASAQGDDTRLLVALVENGTINTEEAIVPATKPTYASLSQLVPSATWYEREIHDLFGLVATDGIDLDPLVFAFPPGSPRPRPGSGRTLSRVDPDLTPLHAHVRGEGVFTIPYGPVRSGVFEAVEYVVETPGEDIPYLRTRIFYKHRGVEMRFEGASIDDGVLVAERCEGVASVAHALAYCEAVERIAGVEISRGASLIRVIHAELERIANHLDSIIRHTEAAGQAVAYARFSLHKEHVQRLRARLCASRFGRGVVVPGGVRGPLQLGPAPLLDAVTDFEDALKPDLALLMSTPSFLDRLRATGILSARTAQRYGALGPLGRASGQNDDVRFTRPYAAYAHLGHQPSAPRNGGDALARQQVRLDEITESLHLIRQATIQLDEGVVPRDAGWRVPVGTPSGEAFGWSESPQGELLYLVTIRDGRLQRVKPRSASFHNLALFAATFPKNILTDFAFIEASFGLSIAGAAS